MEKTKSAYLLWYQYYQTIPKLHRFSLGFKIDKIFTEILEGIITAAFLDAKEKQPYVRFAIRKLDTLKIFLMIGLISYDYTYDEILENRRDRYKV